MAVKFYLLKVQEVNRETHDTVSISFDVPEDLKEIFKYKHGQYITIKIPIRGVENRRAYSICSSPATDEPLTVAVKKADMGTVSIYLNDSLRAGEFIEVMPPLGSFTIDLDPLLQREYVFVGGGSGITPLLSIMKTVLLAEPKSNVHLLYGNRDEDSIIFKNQLEFYESKFADRFKVIHFLSRPGDNWRGIAGRINKAYFIEYLENKLSNNPKDIEYFLCGPQGMMQEIESALQEMDVDKANIHKENFTAPLPRLGEEARTEINLDELVPRNIRLVLYGEEKEMVVEPDETVLTAAQREGFDPPFSCQIGACSTCRARLKSGRIYMEERDSLTDDEIEAGYILTCQSHPLTDDVLVDYDDQY